MDTLSLDPKTTALVLIDLEHGIVSRDLAPYSSHQVVDHCVQLADALRRAGGTIVFVHVKLTDVPRPPADKPSPAPPTPPPDSASELLPTLGIQPGDHLVLKHQWGAFWNTDLHEFLQGKGIQTIVMGGIATNMGVESTARGAFDRRYALVFAEDAMSTMTADMHRFSTQTIFPMMGRVRSTKEILAALSPGAC